MQSLGSIPGLAPEEGSTLNLRGREMRAAGVDAAVRTGPAVGVRARPGRGQGGSRGRAGARSGRTLLKAAGAARGLAPSRPPAAGEFLPPRLTPQGGAAAHSPPRMGPQARASIAAAMEGRDDAALQPGRRGTNARAPDCGGRCRRGPQARPSGLGGGTDMRSRAGAGPAAAPPSPASPRREAGLSRGFRGRASPEPKTLRRWVYLSNPVPWPQRSTWPSPPTSPTSRPPPPCCLYSSRTRPLSLLPLACSRLWAFQSLFPRPECSFPSLGSHEACPDRGRPVFLPTHSTSHCFIYSWHLMRLH